MTKLLFVDTNIYLDFYRIRNEVKTPFLDHLEAIKDVLIVTDQVEMEFKKNRQSAIIEGLNGLSKPTNIQIPGILKNDKSATALQNDQDKIKKRVNKLKQRMERILEEPSRNDVVYQTLQRLFKKKKKGTDLYRGSKERYSTRRLARKRFFLGYPPRKKNDTSLGDSINWEWIVHVAKEHNADIWIVSRDSDYGATYDNNGYINDWLRQEFRERVNKKRKIHLCPKLSTALKEFEIPVTHEEETEEERIIESQSSDSFVVNDCLMCGKEFKSRGFEIFCSECM